MENIVLFILTVGVYSFIWILMDEKILRWNQCFVRVALVALLALPLNINGNVFTIVGNAKSEKSIYSIFSVYQNAGQDASTLFGLAYQKAGRDAVTFFGLAYQNAERDAVTIAGLAYQNAGQDAATVAGLTVYQNAGERARLLIAISLYQRVGEKTRAFGAFSSLTRE